MRMRAGLVETQRHGARLRRVGKGGVWIGECLGKKKIKPQSWVP